MEETRVFFLTVWPAVLHAMGCLVGLIILAGAAWLAFRLVRRLMELFEKPASFKVLVDQWEEVVYGKMKPRPAVAGQSSSETPPSSCQPIQEFFRSLVQYLSGQGVGRMVGIGLMFLLLIILIYVTFDLIGVGTSVLLKFAGKS